MFFNILIYIHYYYDYYNIYIYLTLYIYIHIHRIYIHVYIYIHLCMDHVSTTDRVIQCLASIGVQRGCCNIGKCTQAGHVVGEGMILEKNI